MVSINGESREATGHSHFTASEYPTMMNYSNLKDGKLTNLSLIQNAIYSNISIQASARRDKTYL